MHTEYANVLSRLLLKSGFDSQFAFPILDLGLAGRAFEKFERLLPEPAGVGAAAAPVFVVCLPRTGSTWLQTLLCAHPGLGYFTNWMHHFRSSIRVACFVARLLRLDAHGERFIKDSVINSLHGPSEGLAFWGEWLQQDPASLRYHDIRASGLSGYTLQRIHRTISVVLDQFKGRRRFFCKNPGFIPYAPLLAEIFPDARFIHLIRDPRLTANSMLKLYDRCNEQLDAIKASGKPLAMTLDRFIPYPRLPRLEEYVERFGPRDSRTTSLLWRDAVEFMNEHGDKLPHLLTVRFESILADPRGSVERILDFCGLDSFPVGHVVFDALCNRTGKVNHSNDYTDYSGITAVCEETMTLLGYFPQEAPGRCASAQNTLAPRSKFGDIV